MTDAERLEQLKAALEDANKIVKLTGDKNASVAEAAMYQFAQALTLPLRQGILSGDIHSNIFEKPMFDYGQRPEFPLDLLAPGSEGSIVAYTIPKTGRIPERNVEADVIMVPTYYIGNSIDWPLYVARSAQWDWIGRALQVLRAGFTKKMNDDGWHVLLAAGVDRNIVVYDSGATAAQFTKRLVTLMQTTMARNAGGNSSSLNRGRLTDLYMAPENMADIRNWNVDQIDEITRRDIFVSENMVRIFSTNLHDIVELGASQEYQTYYTSKLSGTLASSDTYLLVGLDLANKDSFVMPMVGDIEINPDPALLRQARVGYYARAEMGVAALDTRRILLGSC